MKLNVTTGAICSVLLRGVITVASGLFIGVSAEGALIYSSGHGDIGVAYEGGQLVLHWHLGPSSILDGNPVGNPPDGEEFDPTDVAAFVSAPPIPRPAGAVWDPIGNAAGENVWILPQVNNPAQPFLGLATEELIPANWSSFAWEVTNVSGPGQFSLWQDGFTPTFAASSANGLPDSFTGPGVGGHDHYNFGFTTEGIYDVAFTVRGMHTSDGLKTDSGVFRFAVGASAVPEPGGLTLVFLLGGALGGWSVLRRFLG
jgi:surface-anchored protein